MPHIDFLHDLVIIFGFSIVVVLVFHRLHLPSIMGFLISGVVLGPYGLNLIDDVEQVKVLAEVGIVMLLFTIGLEFSLTRFWRSRVFATTGGALQVGITIAITALLLMAMGEVFQVGLFWGFLLALSSTVIVLRSLADRNELDAPHGQLAVGILIFQDLIVVPMMLVAPVMSGSMDGASASIFLALAQSLLFLVGILIAALWVIPKVLRLVVVARSREIFVIAVILICLGIALMTSWIGLSLAIGAFIAGLVISESDYSHQALADIMPFRDSFNCLFFVSIGMLLDLQFLLHQPFLIISMAIAVLVLKGAVAGGVTLIMGYPARVAVLVGLSLPQVGEFSIVLAQVGQELGLLVGEGYQLFLSISILTMLATPFLIQIGPHFSKRADSFKPLDQWFGRRGLLDPDSREGRLRNHVIIAGYGFNGRKLANILKEFELPYLIVEIQGDLVQHGRDRGEPIHFGDITRAEVLHRLGVKEAKMLVVAVSDPFALRRAVQVARQASAAVHIIARTRYLRDLDELITLGANDVIPEEFESSLGIQSVVLNRYKVPPGRIAKKIDEIRREGYAKLGTLDVETFLKRGALPAEVDVIRHRLLDDSPAMGKTLAEVSLTARTGAMVVAVIRGEETLSAPGGDFILGPRDTLVLLGFPDEIKQAILFLDEGEPRGRGGSGWDEAKLR